MTPHVSGLGRQDAVWHNTALLLAENLRRDLAGEPLLNVTSQSRGVLTGRRMRVTDVRTVLLTAPGRAIPAWVAAESFLVEGEFRRSSALVVVDTDEGISGLGETVMGYFLPEVVRATGRLLPRRSWSTRAGARPAAAPSAASTSWPSAVLWWGRVGVGMSVLSGVEMALWDICGKQAGKPVHALLGGAAHSRLLAYASGGTAAWPAERCRHPGPAVHRRGLSGGEAGHRASRAGRDGVATGSVPPPYGTWYAATTRRADRGRARQVRGAARGVRARDRAGDRQPRGPGARALVAQDRARRSPRRSRSSTCCSTRSRCGTTTRRATRSCAAGPGSRSRAASA